jgi:hypothetical protein
MYKILNFAALGLALLLSACNSAPKDNTNPTANKTQIDSTKIAADTAAKANISDAPNDDLYLDLATPATYTGLFNDAIVYTGKTDFDFQIDGKTKLIPVAFEVYSQIEKGKKVAGFDLPKDLIDPSQDLEGLPGGNPKLIGKKYQITIAKDLISIKPL